MDEYNCANSLIIKMLLSYKTYWKQLVLANFMFFIDLEIKSSHFYLDKILKSKYMAAILNMFTQLSISLTYTTYITIVITLIHKQ